jgi:hypothetical protein
MSTTIEKAMQKIINDWVADVIKDKGSELPRIFRSVYAEPLYKFADDSARILKGTTK